MPRSRLPAWRPGHLPRSGKIDHHGAFAQNEGYLDVAPPTGGARCSAGVPAVVAASSVGSVAPIIQEPPRMWAQTSAAAVGRKDNDPTLTAIGVPPSPVAPRDPALALLLLREDVLVLRVAHDQRALAVLLPDDELEAAARRRRS